jgi:hypothetical protein
LNYDALWLLLLLLPFLSKYHCFLPCKIIFFLKVKRNPALQSLWSTEISLYLAITNEWNVAKKRKIINEWINLLRDIILMRKSNLIISYKLKSDVNRSMCQSYNVNCQWCISLYKPYNEIYWFKKCYNVISPMFLFNCPNFDLWYLHFYKNGHVSL